MRVKIFKWDKQVPIELMRIEPLRKLYAYDHHKDDEMVFKAILKGGYRGSGNMLKALRVKRHWTQAKAGEKLGVSQSAIDKYEKGKRIMQHRVALKIQEQNGGMTFDIPWHKKQMREKIFKLTKGIHITLMCIEALGKLYAYAYHKDDE